MNPVAWISPLRSAAFAPPRAGNQHSRYVKESDSLVAHAFLRAVSPFVATSIPVVAHTLSVPRRDSSRRRGTVQPKTTKQTQFRRTPVKSTPAKDKPRSADLAFEIRGLLLKAPDSLVARAFLRAGVNPKNETVVVATSIPAVAHALSVPRRDSSRRLGAVQSKTTKQTQSRRTPVESTPSNDEPRSVDLAFEIRGLCSAPPPTDNASPSGAASPHRTGNQHSGHRKASDSLVAHAFLRAVSPFVATSIPRSGARSQRAASRLLSTPGGGSIENDETNPMSPNPCGIHAF